MLRAIALLFSLVFHPLLMLTYILVILLIVNPYLFSISNVSLTVIQIFIYTFIMPAFAVVMMKLLGLVQTWHLEERQERIGPYIVTGIFYLWIFRALLQNPEIPMAYNVFVLGTTISLFIAFIINLFHKISAHAAGMGGLVGMTLITTILFSYGSFSIGSFEISMVVLLMLAILLSGIVCTSRLLLNAHTLQEIYGGFIVGFSTQFIALQILT